MAFEKGRAIVQKRPSNRLTFCFLIRMSDDGLGIEVYYHK